MAGSPQTPQPPGAPDDPPPAEGDALSEQLAEIRRELRSLRRELRVVRKELHAGARAAPGDRISLGALTIPTFGVPERLNRFRLRWVQEREWSPPRSLIWDIAAIVIIGLVAWLLRYVDITTIPPGLHNDEAAIGLEARRILDDGWIGVYSGIAGGNPTGHFYLATVVVTLISDPALAVRVLSAIGGTVAVIGVYVLMCRNLGFGSALVGSTLLAFSGWHIQFSRIGFVTGMWPTFVLLGSIALMEAIRSRSWLWWAAAGALLSSGIYIYNGHTPFMLVLGLFIGWYLFGWMAVASAGTVALVYLAPSPVTVALLGLGLVLLAFNRHLRDRQRVINATAFGVSSLVVLWGMIRFVRANPQDYLDRGSRLSVYRSEEWHARPGVVDRAELLLDRYWLFWNRLTFDPIPNGADLSGVTPLVPKMTLAIFLIGAVVALVRRPNALLAFSAVIVALAPLSAALTDMTLRRALVIIPFLAVLGGVGVIEVFRIAVARHKVIGAIAAVLLVAAIGRSSYANYTDFFDETVNSVPVQHTWSPEIQETSRFLDTLPTDAYVYLFSGRWGLGHDVVRLLAPDIQGADRLEKWGGSGGHEVDRSLGSPVFVLIGGEAARLAELQRLYPGGTVTEGSYLGPPFNGQSFVAYVLP